MVCGVVSFECVHVHILADHVTLSINGFVPGDGTAVIDRHGGAYFGEIWKGITV